MSKRAYPILFLLLLACRVSARTAATELDIYDYAGLEPSTLNQFAKRAQDILSGAGVSIRVELCDRRITNACAAPIQGDGHLVIRVISGPAKKMTNTSRSPLGQSFADVNGGIYGSVFLERIKDEAAEANVPWVILLAYATAHEVGHLLLGSEAHTPLGLMKAHWDKNDYQAMNQNRFHFSQEQIREFAAYGGLLSARTPLERGESLRR